MKKGCLVVSYLRGEGAIPNQCRRKEEKSGDLCFPRCKKGYTGAGPICLQNCPPAYTDTGDFCRSPAPYGRGPGYLLSEKQQCIAESSTRACERFGQLYYPKCQPGFHHVGCCACVPDSGETFSRDGFRKRTYGRGPGKQLICDEGKEFFEGLCYPKCKRRYTGVGPVCWGECPPRLHRCGHYCSTHTAFCFRKTDKILRDIGNVITSLLPRAHHLHRHLFLSEFEIKKALKKKCKLLGRRCHKFWIKKTLKAIPFGKHHHKYKVKFCHREH